MRNARRTEEIEKDVRNRMGRYSDELRKDFLNRMQSTERRLNTYDQQLSEFHEDIRELEKKQNRKLREQAEKFQKGLNSLQSQVTANREEYLRMFDQQREEFSNALEAQRKNLQSQISALNDRLAKKEANEQQLAQTWIENTKTLISYIDEHQSHEKFKPGALEKIRAELQLSEGNFKQGVYQAAIASAQQSFIRASELRIEIEQLEVEWSAYLEAAKQSATELLATCEAQESCRFALDTEDGSIEMEGQIDFWTEGALSGLKKNAKNELKRLGKPDDLALEELKASIRQSEQWKAECLTLTEKAKQALIASQLRNNMAQTIANALENAGWEVTDSTYEGEDHRGAIHVKLENYSGDEIVTIITPEEGEDDTIYNRVHVSFFDRTSNDESFRQERLKMITNTLQEEGLECGEPKCEPGTENKPSQDERKLDFKEVRKAKRKLPQSQEKTKKTSK
ncbi:MAG: hypothetical protein CV087_16085 [Candidatus Brocadia sp. WS118]|nr:MAG: hypothetical protein CV087_16085 [Candidatus Brocadia sp. WS118]